MACEKFKALDPSSHKKILAKAQKIYDEYVRVEAPKEVNLDSITRATTVTNLSNPNRHCFDHAQRRVRHVLEKDVYPRFLHFNLYTQLLETCSDAVTELKVASWSGGYTGVYVIIAAQESLSGWKLEFFQICFLH